MKLTQDDPVELRVADQQGRVLLDSRYAGWRFAMREEADGKAILTPMAFVSQEELVISRCLAERFAALEALRDDWDGHGSPAPALARGLPWEEPHLGANERGQVTLEWWQGDRTLTLFIRSEDQVDYLKTWGSHVQDEMEDGEVSHLASFIALSRWLFPGEGTEA